MKRYTRYHKTNPPPYSAWNALPCRLRQRPSETAKGISAARRERIKAAAARAQPHRGWIAADPSQGGVRVLVVPRATDEEKAARTAAIRAAAVTAAEVPLRTLEACRDVVVASEALAGRSNRNAASDLAVASRLAEAAAHGAAENVMVNLPALGNEDRADELRGRVATLLAEVGDHAESTRAFVELGELRDPEPDPQPDGPADPQADSHADREPRSA